MGETRDRGVLASAECIKELKAAQARQRNAEGKVWTQTDIEIESGVNIVGLRRIGKTSLLRYIRSNPTEFIQPERQPLIVSLDLRNVALSSPEGILEGLRVGIMHQQQGKEPWAKDKNSEFDSLPAFATSEYCQK